MNLSPYFHDLCGSYRNELEDLSQDTDGRDVLQARLREKRRPDAFAALLDVLDISPEAAAVAFHGAFGFPRGADPELAGLLTLYPDEFPDWSALSAGVEIAPWALPMIDEALARDDGAQFMCTVLALEYFGQRDALVPAGPDPDAGPRDEDDDAGDDDEGVIRDEDADAYLEDQGFDRRSEQ